MLEKLNVSNISILGDTEVSFGDGLNIATGETGAGKSLILSTLVSFVAKRFPKELIKDKNKQTEITILLKSDNKIFNEMLMPYDVKIYNDYVKITRKIDKDNSSKYFINDSKVKVEIVSKIFENFFSFFVQGAQSFIVEKKYQQYILDKFSSTDTLLNDYRATYKKYIESSKLRKKLINQKNDINEKRDFLSFQLNELKKINIHDDREELEFIEEVKNQKVINDNKEKLDELISYIDNVAIDSIKDIENKIMKSDFFTENIRSIAKDLSVNINELSYQVSILRTESIDNELYNYKQEQLFLLKDLKRKYKLTTNQLIKKKEEIEELFNNEFEIDNIINSIEKENLELKKICINKAKDISRRRKSGSEVLTKLIKKGLSDLGIPICNWLVSFREVDINDDGIDDIEFLFSANPDFPPESLKSVASGGELSRIMLILSLEISKIFESKIILFDEPDVGLGGAIAEKLGEKISKLSRSSQVLCISHLPQVASFADTHLYISKKIKNGSTTINIKNLSKDERVVEIARMMSGKKIEDEALLLADKMIK